VFDRLSKSQLSEPLPQSYVGLGYLDNVFPHRYRSSANGMKSVHDAFHDDRELVRAIEYVAESGRVPTRDVVLRNVKFNVGMPSHVLPESAAALVSAYAPGGDVFDPFLGWGGRTLGAACAGARSVFGTDLQALSVDGCRRVISDLSGLSSCAGDFHHCDFSELMGSTDRQFDLVLTSPPFVDTEDYGSGRHGTTQAWIQSVVIPLVRGCGRVLRPGGRAAVHVQERPKVPVMTSVLSCFSGAGWAVEAEHGYGRKGGQKVLVFRRAV
jgi:16S rRNA G966 N2-methylase RsmD